MPLVLTLLPQAPAHQSKPQTLILCSSPEKTLNLIVTFPRKKKFKVIQHSKSVVADPNRNALAIVTDILLGIMNNI